MLVYFFLYVWGTCLSLEEPCLPQLVFLAFPVFCQFSLVPWKMVDVTKHAQFIIGHVGAHLAHKWGLVSCPVIYNHMSPHSSQIGKVWTGIAFG